MIVGCIILIDEVIISLDWKKTSGWLLFKIKDLEQQLFHCILILLGKFLASCKCPYRLCFSLLDLFVNPFLLFYI